MKPGKKIKQFFVLLLVVFVNHSVFGQQTLSVGGQNVSYAKYINSSQQEEYSTGSYSTGRYEGTPFYDDSPWVIDRSSYEFNIGALPSNATITAVRLVYTAGSTGSNYNSTSFKVTDYTPSGSSTYAQRWSSIGSSAAIFSSLSGSSGTNTSSSLTSKVENSRSLGVFFLGAASNNEGTDGSWAVISITIEIDYTLPPNEVDITAQNNFIYGSIKVGVKTTATSVNSPFPISPTVGDAVNLEAEEQEYGGYYRIWNDTEAPLNKSKWEKIVGINRTQVATSLSHNFTAAEDDDNSTYEAGLRKSCQIELANQYSGISYQGQIIVNDSTKTAPYTTKKVEQNMIQFRAISYYDINYIRYIFTKWSDNVTSESRSIYPSSHSSYTAQYTGYPIYTDGMRGLSFSSVRVGDNYHLKLSWSEHPNSNVTQYHIYRYTKEPDGSTTSPVQIGTTNRGTTTFTDSDFNYNPLTGDHQIYYDVRAYFSLDGTTSPVNYSMAKGGEAGGELDKKGSEIEELITEYAISNYPNPFNPSTTIQYQLPQAGLVQIKIYDMLGKEVAILVNRQHESGSYQVSFGNDDLPSGLYIYTMQVNDYTESKKMLLVK